MQLQLEESGRISTTVEVGDVQVQDRFYPFCGMTVETACFSENGWVVSLPDSYLQVSDVHRYPKIEP